MTKVGPFEIVKAFLNMLVIISVIIIGIFIGVHMHNTASAASQWQAPTQAPPSGNIGVPINAGTDAQSKGGDFYVLSDTRGGISAALVGATTTNLNDVYSAMKSSTFSEYGVGGYSAKKNGVGIRGDASKNEGIGVVGSGGTDGYGVYGTSTSDYGVVGRGILGTGVYGISGGQAISTTSSDTSGKGVKGDGRKVGVEGTGTMPSAYGMIASGGSAQYGIYASGGRGSIYASGQAVFDNNVQVQDIQIMKNLTVLDNKHDPGDTKLVIYDDYLQKKSQEQYVRHDNQQFEHILCPEGQFMKGIALKGKMYQDEGDRKNAGKNPWGWDDRDFGDVVKIYCAGL